MATGPSCAHENPGGQKFCGECGSSLGAPAPAREVRKTVTALFCDLVGSTTLAETHDPEVLRPLLHAYFEQMRAAVERHGGRVEKFIGDAVSAVFGLPTSHEDDALRAVRAAVEMRERLETLNEGSAVELACRIGVTTGEVLVPSGSEPLIPGSRCRKSPMNSPNGKPCGSTLITTWLRQALLQRAIHPAPPQKAFIASPRKLHL